ncbi:hypothetical protein Y032_0618g704 [Ancylostoma ceylanicum]|uniref:Uncharacterized protein n=1 Tax=Ancylostoma ceylanicum TaxID=53326 RepID=A0A016WMS2_9BILA|nr:hypothetical protein Y032_0618g704 [Ancylostoma ceylanicum]
MRSKWPLGLLVVLLLPAVGTGETYSKPKVGPWLQWMTLVPLFFNIITLCFMLLAILYIRETKKLSDAIVTRLVKLVDYSYGMNVFHKIISSTRLLSRCAIRLKVGKTAKKSIREYARTDPDLCKLLLRKKKRHVSTEKEKSD